MKIMSAVFEIFNQFAGSALPALISALVVAFYLFGKKSIEVQLQARRQKLRESGSDEKEEPQFADHLKHLIRRDDTTLRVLEEVFSAGKTRYAYFGRNPDARRVSTLRQIQDSLRQSIKDSLQDDAFPTIRDRAIKLIDHSQREIDALQQRKPFEGLQEPEKSLLVDILAELPEERPIPRQKAIQLADIIKLKHQDILNLQAENAKSAAWTRWGTYGTIFFGVLSIVLSIYTTAK